MKAAIGFKGRYFTLAAIQALNSAIKMQAVNSTFISVAVVYNALSDIQEDDNPPPDLTSWFFQDSFRKNYIHAPRVPTVEEIEKQIHSLLEVLPARQLWINPDCGLKTRRWEEVRPSLKKTETF